MGCYKISYVYFYCIIVFDLYHVLESPTTPSIIPTTILTTLPPTTVSKQSLSPDTTGAATPKRVNIGSEHLLWFGKSHFVESILSDCLRAVILGAI